MSARGEYLRFMPRNFCSLTEFAGHMLKCGGGYYRITLVVRSEPSSWISTLIETPTPG